MVQAEYLPRQGEFLQSCKEVPFAAYIGGFGSGKTHVLCLQVLIEAATPSFGLIGAPTYRLLADTTRRKFFELCPPSWIKSFSKSENKVLLKNGSEIIFRSLDAPERLTNLEVDWFCIDEVGECKLDTFRMLQGRIRKVGGSHHGFCVGNPAGPTHWTYDYYVHKAREFPNTYRLTQASSYENIFIAQDYTEEMERSFGKDSLYFKRFVLGEFVAFEGAYWPEFTINPYPNGNIVSFQDIPKILHYQKNKWRFGRVIDFGFEHPWVCLWYVTDGNKIIFYDEYYQRHRLIQHHVLAIRAKEKIHREEHYFENENIKTTWADTDAQDRAEVANCKNTKGELIGFNTMPAEKKVMESILLVQRLIANDALFITTLCPHSTVEIPSYRAKPMDKCIDEKPIKEKDDTCDCIRMACWGELNSQMKFLRAHSSSYSTNFSRATNSPDLYNIGSGAII